MGVDKFEHVRSGTLVRRSRHWHRVHKSWPLGQLGIVVDRNVYQEGDRLITYPVIHWEGEHGSSGTHPDNADVATSRYAKRGRR